MASLFVSLQTHRLVFPHSSFPDRTGAPTPLLPSRTHFYFSGRKPSTFLRGGSVVVRLGPSPGLPDFESAEGWARELFDRAEGVLYTVADAVASSSSSSDTAAAAAEGTKQTGDWLSGITSYMETVLKILKDGLSALHVPYAYGFAIILLTIIVKAATFPLTKKQVESAMAVRSLQPQVKAIQECYAGDQERIQLETARLYKLAGVNPLAGCLPTLATIPVWIGLYRALSNVANEGLLTEGFFWIPSLAGPTTIAARQSGSGISWLFPFVDGHPPLGWSDTITYLVLPTLLVLSQYVSAKIMQPSQGNDPSQKNSQAITKLLPLMIGYFALSVPSGLNLYWFTNNVLSSAQQIWLQKLGGAKNPVRELSDRTTKETKNPVSEFSVRTTKEPQLNIPKSGFKVDSDKVKTSPEEKSETGGLRPGERFKQIKEQEARKSQEREVDRRRAEEAAKAKESQINNEVRYSEAKIVESKEQVEVVSAKGVDEGLQSVTAMHDCSNVTAMVNDIHSKQDSEEQTKIHLSMSNNGGFSCNGDAAVKDEQSAHKDLQEEVVAETPSSTGNKTSSEHDVLDRREQTSERNEA